MKLSEMRTEVTPKRINKVMESRFGFSIDYDNLTYAKAQRISHAIGESLATIKNSHEIHAAEKNPKYIEMMLVKEGLDKWMSSEQGLFESEMGKSEAVLAAKDVVDSIQDMLEKISKIQNEQMPALVDTIRDQIGTEQAEAFKSSMTPVLAGLYETLTTSRETADGASRALAGEQVAQPMDMGGMDTMGGDEFGADALGGPESDFDSEVGGEEEGDGLDATDAATGGSQTLGRGRR